MRKVGKFERWTPRNVRKVRKVRKARKVRTASKVRNIIPKGEKS